ncbi:MAG: asparaginase, partial [Pseudomonadota bacterium]
MTEAANPVLAEVWRGQILESVHRGSAVVCRADGTIEAAWGDPSRIILPRSSCKMVQALPLVESGIADRRGLTDRHLALACASHQGAAVHTDLARAWLSDLGLAEAALRCGPQIPSDAEARHGLRESGVCADQTHNNCSGKHCGFLTLGQALGGGAEYHEVDHPVQEAVRQATAEVADEELGAFAIDGCSAPNYAMSLRGLATSMARFAVPGPDGRGRAMARLVGAMAAHPVLVAGERRACTALIRACAGRAVVKTGAEGVFV